MKKTSLFLSAALILCIFVSGCSGKEKNEIAGREQVEALRKAAESYESASYFIKNVETDELEQVFSFMYDTDDTQIYLSEGIQNESYYMEYSNGKELFRESNGVGGQVPPADDRFALYSRKSPHPYSTGQLLFYVKEYIETSEERTDELGNTLYIYYYDTEKLNKTLGGSLTSFVTSYAFDGSGRFVYFRQHNSSDLGLEEEVDYTYEIYLKNVNSIDKIENPIVSGNDD